MTDEGWLTRLAVVLGEVVPRVGRLAVEIEESWPDRGGREWAERLALAQRELGRLEVLVATLWSSGGKGRPSDGPRLPGTDGRRVDDASGIRIAELPPP